MNGWGVRPWNWEFSTGVQHEIMPRLSTGLTYFRRVQGNFFVTDNEALGASDFIPFSVTLPTDPRLPNSGRTLTGLYDQRAVVVNRNVVKAAGQFGNQYQHWNGFDLTVDSRPRQRLVPSRRGQQRRDDDRQLRNREAGAGSLAPDVGILSSPGHHACFRLQPPSRRRLDTRGLLPPGQRLGHHLQGAGLVRSAVRTFELAATFQSVQGPIVGRERSLHQRRHRSRPGAGTRTVKFLAQDRRRLA